MIYMYALPRAMPQYKDAKLAGQIVYNDRTDRVPPCGIDQSFVRNLSELIRRIAAPDPPSSFPAPKNVDYATSPCRTAPTA